MDPKKKRQYIILLAAAVVFAVGFVFWTRSSVPAEELLLPASSPTSTQLPTATKSGTETVYSPPAVFPQNTNFDALVVGQLKTFQNFQPSKLGEGELGRANPFNNY